jgi:hypothetical protein
MEGMYMEIALVALSIISISFLIAYISASKKLKSVSDGFAQLFILHNKMIDSSSILSNADGDVHQENFIKFLSDSREWAFSYIENVQNGLKKFIDEVEPQIEYYDKYGVVVEGMIPAHDFALKKISTELKELKKLLPEDILDDRR